MEQERINIELIESFKQQHARELEEKKIKQQQ